jgi:hypothetical protein
MREKSVELFRARFLKKRKKFKDTRVCVFFFGCAKVVCKKNVSSDALELHMLIREAKQTQ